METQNLRNAFGELKELSQLQADEFARGGIKTNVRQGTMEQMNEAWTEVKRQLQNEDELTDAEVFFEKVKLLSEIYETALNDYKGKLRQASREDLARPQMRE